MSATPEWIADDEGFRRQLTTGHRWQRYVAERLRAEGLVVHESPLSFRHDFDDRHRYRNEADLVVGDQRLEVKSRDRRFWSPADYPYPTALVDTVDKWDARDPEPLALLLVSQKTRTILVVPASTKEHWIEETHFDRFRQFDEVFYAIARERLVSFETLVAFLEWKT